MPSSVNKRVHISKTDALNIVFSAAKSYQQNFVGRNLLFLCADKHMKVSFLEVQFTASRFLHLTGFDVDQESISPEDFFQRCLDNRLSINDFEFNADGTTPLKMRALPKVMQKDLSANMVGDYSFQRPKLYTEKLAGGILACIGFVKNNGDGEYVPNTLLASDIKDNTNSTLRILATFRKMIGQEKYDDVVRIAKKVEWDKVTIPIEYEYLRDLIDHDNK